MPKTIYDKPTRALLKDMLTAWDLKPGQVFTSARAIEWFGSHYPKLKPASVRAHLVQASTNDRSRLHHPATNESDDLLFKVDSGQFRLYEPGRDPTPIHEMVAGDVARQEVDDELSDEGDETDLERTGEPHQGSSEFLLGRDLQRYLAKNLEVVEAGLKLYVDEETGLEGLEFDAGNGRRIDILAVDRDGGFVVLELKVSRGYDRVVGQLLRYMNWVRREVAVNGERVRGLIVCRAMSEDLRLACSSIPDVELCEYQLSVTVSKVPALAPRR